MSSVLLSGPIQKLWDKHQQQASRANVMHNMDVLIKFPGIVSNNRSSTIYKIAFVSISTFAEFSLHMLQQHNEHIRHMKFIIHMHV